jgi:acetyltransferase-like isoleucine patch superfamily enzyme
MVGDEARVRPRNMKAFVHPTAILEDGVVLGEDTKVWDNVHIRKDTHLGEQCMVGEKTHIAYDVRIGNRVKINAFVYICTAVTIEDGVMISAGTIFTNDRFPRAATADLSALLPSSPDEHTQKTLVCAGATIGAGCVIGSDLSIGRFAMVGMGSVVTKSVPDFHLVIGNPARTVGFVCRCGQPLRRFAAGEFPAPADTSCSVCHRKFHIEQGGVIEYELVRGGV